MSNTNTKEIAKVEVEVLRLRREFERYFAGANDLPPHELEARVSRHIDRLRSASRTASERFRIDAIEANFASYRELFRRRLREREEGVRTRPAKGPVDPPPPDVRAGVEVGADIRSGGSEQAVLSLYKGLYGDTSSPQVGVEQFRNYLAEQAARIQAKTGCEKIVFRLAEDGGKQRLKAKPVSSS